MKCEGETGTEAGLGRGEGVAWLWAGRFSFHVRFVSLHFRAGTGWVLRCWGSKWGSYRSLSTKGILFEGLINVSDLFFFPVIPSVAGRDFGLRAFNVCDIVIKYSCGAIQVIDSRVTGTWSHQMGVAWYSRLLNLLRFFPSHSVWSSTKPSSSHSCTSAPKFRLYDFLLHVIV